jgi:hypothetical protein
MSLDSLVIHDALTNEIVRNCGEFIFRDTTGVLTCDVVKTALFVKSYGLYMAGIGAFGLFSIFLSKGTIFKALSRIVFLVTTTFLISLVSILIAFIYFSSVLVIWITKKEKEREVDNEKRGLD